VRAWWAVECAGLHERANIVLDYSPDGATLQQVLLNGKCAVALTGEKENRTTGLWRRAVHRAGSGQQRDLGQRAEERECSLAGTATSARRSVTAR